MAEEHAGTRRRTHIEKASQTARFFNSIGGADPAGEPVSVNGNAFLGNLHNVFSLRTFWTVRYFELNLLALNESFIAIAGDSAVMHEDILLTGLLDKTVALCVIEPFDHTDSF